LITFILVANEVYIVQILLIISFMVSLKVECCAMYEV